MRFLPRGVQPIPPTDAQESVWDYPRPPAVDPTGEHVVVVLGGEVVVDTRRAIRVLETSHPPSYYLPVVDVRDGALRPSTSGRRSVCEYKGQAAYWDLVVGERVEHDVAWSYPQPWRGYESLRDHIALYAGRMDEVSVDGERVRAQDGGFYGGWITDRVVGPFKGVPGSMGW